MEHVYRADLHCHSTFSDGMFSPEEIVLLAKKKQCDVVVLTDHDTFSGFFELQASAERENIFPLTGIEISTVFEELSVHLLGYSFNPSSPSFLAYEKRARESRKARAGKILDKLRSSGIDITEEELLSQDGQHGSLGRPHIARLLVKKQYVRTVYEGFEKYLGDFRSAYVPSERMPLDQAIEFIHQAGGVAVLAHPHLYRNKKRVLDILDRFSFDGIESFYCRFEKRENNFWSTLAQQRKLLSTGGSDFHGEGRNEDLYGSSQAPEETTRFLSDLMIKNR